MFASTMEPEMFNFSLSPDQNFSSNITDIQHDTAEWGRLVKMISTHIIVVIGLVANTLTFMVMKTPRLRYKSYSHYLSALAVFDSLVLVSLELHVIDEMLRLMYNQHGLFYNFSHESCKVNSCHGSVCNLMSSWLIVAMAIERFCVVYMPFRRNMWCQQRGAVIIIISLFCVMSCIQVFRFVMVGNNGDTCAGVDNNIYLLLHIYVYQFALLFTTPVTIVLICNIGVLVRILEVERATQNEESSSTRLTGSSRRRSKTTRMLLAISFTYIVTALPHVTLTIFVHVMLKLYHRDFVEGFVQAVPWMEFLQAISNVNYASNFFIYILSGKKFRKELRRIFTHERVTSYTVGSTRTRDEILMMSY
ncbi:FMRFamide peptide receptor frpr-18-like [Physella acuta]|uniref:FMRFamide peptide receptor frpr-18-like n=1 Tax=Physella acuta TaxID=109671 RepID=UPI0027DC695F|nr:FMRFamide peptide receptor frpr-18-like [Physella acuta]